MRTALFFSMFIFFATLAEAQIKVTWYYPNGSKKQERDIITGYRRYWYENGGIQMQGWVIEDTRDSIWQTYSQEGLLIVEEKYRNLHKISTRTFMYWDNNKPMSEEYEFVEGDSSNLYLRKVIKLYYTNGQVCSERHLIRGQVVKTRTWNPNGKRIFLKRVKTLVVD